MTRPPASCAALITRCASVVPAATNAPMFVIRWRLATSEFEVTTPIEARRSNQWGIDKLRFDSPRISSLSRVILTTLPSHSHQSARSPRRCVGIILVLDPPLAVRQPALREHFHIDFVLVGPIADNLDLDWSGNELPGLPFLENNLLIGFYILRRKGLADPLPHRQIRLVSEPERVVRNESRIAVVNLRGLSLYAGKP